MARSIYILSALIIISVLSFFFLPPSLTLYYKKLDGTFVKARLVENLKPTELNISLAVEKKLSTMLYMSPPGDGDVTPAWEHLRKYFVSDPAADQFFYVLNGVNFFDHLITNEQHVFFAPTSNTVVPSQRLSNAWYTQTKGLLTFRSSGDDKTIGVIISLEVRKNKRNGEYKFSKGAIKTI